MDFIKELFKDSENGVMSYEQFKAKADEAGIKFANLAEGKYVSKQKYDDDLAAKDTQISTLNTTISTRDTDLADIKAQLEQAGVDKDKLSTLSADLTALQGKYDTEVKSWESKLAKQAYEFAVKDYANSKQFSSNAAKRDFINTMIAKELKMDNDKILGADDFANSYSAENEDAFVVEQSTVPKEEKAKPTFVEPTGGADPDSGESGFNFSFAGVRPKE